MLPREYVKADGTLLSTVWPPLFSLGCLLHQQRLYPFHELSCVATAVSQHHSLHLSQSPSTGILTSDAPALREKMKRAVDVVKPPICIRYDALVLIQSLEALIC